MRWTPGRVKRMVLVQEVETVLCKWKAHRNGHYPPGKDTRELRQALRKVQSTAARIQAPLRELLSLGYPNGAQDELSVTTRDSWGGTAERFYKALEEVGWQE